MLSSNYVRPAERQEEPEEAAATLLRPVRKTRSSIQVCVSSDYTEEMLSMAATRI